MLELVESIDLGLVENEKPLLLLLEEHFRIVFAKFFWSTSTQVPSQLSIC